MTETVDTHATAISDFAGHREAKRLLSLYEELDAVDPHIAAVIREEPVESGDLYQNLEGFVEALEEAAKDRAGAQHILEERSAELSGRKFHLLAAEFEHLVTDHLQAAREEIPLRERAATVRRLYAELLDVVPSQAAALLELSVYYRHPSPQMRGGATYKTVLDALEKASEKSWDNIESDPDGLAMVMLKSDIGVMEDELREQLRNTGAVVAL